jgi:hypothetical protein
MDWGLSPEQYRLDAPTPRTRELAFRLRDLSATPPRLCPQSTAHATHTADIFCSSPLWEGLATLFRWELSCDGNV